MSLMHEKMLNLLQPRVINPLNCVNQHMTVFDLSCFPDCPCLFFTILWLFQTADVAFPNKSVFCQTFVEGNAWVV